MFDLDRPKKLTKQEYDKNSGDSLALVFFAKNQIALTPAPSVVGIKN